MVVTLEARRSAEIIDQINAIQALPGVYSASLVYQHHEDIYALDQEIRDEPDASKLY
jgi:nitrate reductase NapD